MNRVVSFLAGWILALLVLLGFAWLFAMTPPAHAGSCGIRPIRPIRPIGCVGTFAPQCSCNVSGQNCRWYWVCSG